jgi:dipeptide/tripeptide permease
MNILNNEYVNGFLRHGLTFLGGWLADQGYLAANQTDLFSGGVICIIGVILSLFHKHNLSQSQSSPVVPATPSK